MSLIYQENFPSINTRKMDFVTAGGLQLRNRSLSLHSDGETSNSFFH
jgi:hypothetical protein